MTTIERKREVVKEFRLLVEDIVDSLELIPATIKDKEKVQDKLIEAYNAFRELIFKTN